MTGKNAQQNGDERYSQQHKGREQQAAVFLNIARYKRNDNGNNNGVYIEWLFIHSLANLIWLHHLPTA
jgi:hypothetical protein